MAAIATPILLRSVARRACTAAMRQRRWISTEGTSQSASHDESAWAHIFKDLDDNTHSASAASEQPLSWRGRQTMTPREIKSFDKMFNMIFDAVSEHQQQQGIDTNQPRVQSLNESLSRDSLSQVAIGGGESVADLMFRLRKHSRKVQLTSADDELLDRKKEEMELCESDHQLLQWALREVFDDSVQHEARARTTRGAPLQNPLYPRLLALLMRAFRDRFGDAHAALALFEHARHLSTASFVFGCTTPAYNELLETRWRAFRDLRGVRDALAEMRANGVDCDSTTRAIVEMVRREVGKRTLWLEDSLVGGEALAMVKEIEQLAAFRSAEKRRDAPGRRVWKNANQAWKPTVHDDESLVDVDWADQMFDGSAHQESSFEYPKSPH